MTAYVTVHQKLVEERGSASAHAYSADLDCYEPLCRKCHRRLDIDLGHRVANQIRRQCSECGLVAHPAALGAHQKGSGRQGYADLPKGTS